jgi:MFS family permease
MTIMQRAYRAGILTFASNPQTGETEDHSSESARLMGAVRPIQPDHRTKSRSSWQVLSQRDFRRYFLGSLISNLGTWLQSTAQVLIAYQVTRSVFMVGLIASAQFAGMVVSPWAPVLAARFSSRAVLVGTQGLSALIAILMAGLHFAGILTVGWLLAGALGLGFAFALALPVQTALVPKLVRDEDAADAVRMNSVSYNAGRAVAPALCVPVIILIGPDLIFALNAVSFVIFVTILRRLPRIADDISFRATFAHMHDRLSCAIVVRASLCGIANPASETYATGPRTRVRDGLVAALRRRRILLLLAIVGAVTLAEDPILVLSPAVTTRLHIPSATAGYFIAALGWGVVLGSLPPTSVRGNDAKYASRRAAISLLILGASIFVFAWGFSFKLSLVATIVAGAAGLFTGTAAQTALLRHRQEIGADVATVASVAALWAIAWAGTKPFASLLDGWLAVHIGTVATCGVLVLPAFSIALGELLLPQKIKININNCSEGIAKDMVNRLVSSASADAGPKSHTLLNGIEADAQAVPAAAGA